MATTMGNSQTAGIDVGRPFVGLHRDLELLHNYIKSFDWETPEDSLAMPGPQALEAICEQGGRKPRLAFFGNYDVGKSTLVNTILGTAAVQTAFQPATRVLTFLRHTSERPSWLSDSVLILRHGFDPEDWADEGKCNSYRIAAGGLDVLRDHGTYQHDKEVDDSEAAVALVFLDNPVLESCTIIDTPGFDSDNEADSNLALDQRAQVDIAVWADASMGFLSKSSLLPFGMILRRLPWFREIDAPLANLYVVATHAHDGITEEQLESEILANARMRLWRHVGGTALVERTQDSGVKIEKTDLDRRFFPFYRESVTRSRGLLEDLANLLGLELPQAWTRRAKEQIEYVRDSGGAQLEAIVRTYQQTIDNRAEVENKLSIMREDEPRRQERAARLVSRIEAAIIEERDASIASMRRFVAMRTSEEALEAFIRSKFEDKKDAKGSAADLVLEELQHNLSVDLQPRAAKVSGIVAELVDDYEQASLAGQPKIGEVSAFNAKGAFFGGMAGLGAVGALSLWAGTLGNLGAYILVAKAASISASLGFAAGGSAAWTTAVAAIGGPVTIAVGIIALGVVGGIILARGWQKQLAKGIAKSFQKNDIAGKFQTGIEDFWKDTRVACMAASSSVEQEWQEFRDHLQQIVEENDVSRIQELLELARKRWDWFLGLHPD